MSEVIWLQMLLGKLKKKKNFTGLPRWLSGKKSTARAGDTGSFLIQGDASRRRAAKPGCHGYWACALGPSAAASEACVP